MSIERKRFYVELVGYILIVGSIICSLVSATLAYNPAGADPTALSTVIVSISLLVVGVVLVRFIPWREPKPLLDKVDGDEFVF